MDEGSPRPKLSKQQRDLVSLAFEVGLFLILLGVGTVTYNHRHITTKVEEKTVTVTASPQALASAAPTVSTETVTTSMGDVAPDYKLTLTAPKAWRGVDTKGFGYQYPGFERADYAAMLRFVPDHVQRQKLYGLYEPTSSIDVLATNHWVATSQEAPATSANKQAWLQYVGSLKTVADVSAKKCVAVEAEGSACQDLKVKPEIIKTADGALSGLVYLTLPAGAPSYNPVVKFDMVGTVGSQAVWATGMFQVYDKLTETLSRSGAKANQDATDFVSRVMSATDAFEKNPPADTLETYTQIVGTLKSMKFSK